MKKIIHILLLCLPVFSSAQWTNNTLLNTTVRDSIGTGEETPLSATRLDGKTYVSFFESAGGSYQLRMQLLDSSGNKLWASAGILVSNQPQSSALFRYDLKVDQNGDAIVAFQDIRTGGNLNVVVYKVDVTGSIVWGSNGISLIDPVSTEGLAPTIGITNSNNIVVGWNADASSNKWVAIQKISPTGNTMWPTMQRVIDSTNTKKFSRPTFVAAGVDEVIMLYVQETGNFPATSVMYAQRLDLNGAKIWANASQVSSKAIPYFFFPKAESDDVDGFYVAYNTSNAAAPSQTDVYVQRVDGAGTTWNATGNVACALANTQHFTNGAKYDAVNSALWISLKITDVNQGQSGVYIQKMDAGGNILLGANAVQLLPVSAAYNDTRDFSITSDGVITIYSIVSNSLAQTLAAVKNDFAGNIMWLGPVTICSNSSGKDDLTAGLFSNNQVVLVWDDSRNDYGVYAQNITNEGLLGVITSLQEIEKENIISVSPNPFQNSLQIIKGNIPGKSSLKIYNVLGEEVFSGNNKESEHINTEMWNDGIYFVKTGNDVIKIVKQ